MTNAELIADYNDAYADAFVREPGDRDIEAEAHAGALLVMIAQAEARALEDAMSIYEQIVCDGGEINHEENNYAAGFAHGAYAFNEAIRARLPHATEPAK